MAVSVIKGQKVDLTKTNQGITNVTAIIGWSAPPEVEVDTSAFLLAQNGKVKGDEDLIFYGNASNSFISYHENSSSERQVKINLTLALPSVEKIAFTLTLYEGELRRQTFSQVSGVYVGFINDTTGQEIIRYDLENNLSVETAIVIGELYRYNGEWKFNAIGAGYSGGLKALCGSYGIEVKDTPNTNQPQPTPIIPPVQPRVVPKPIVPTPAPSPEKPIHLNLSKIELKKKGDTINLEKKSGGLGEILINLNWNQQGKKSSIWKRNQGVDLDLACLYELKDGRKGIVQALGDSFGSLTREPYIMLDGDDRTGSIKTGENIRINGSKLSEFRRILVFTFIYEGVSNWAEADGVVTIKQNGGPDIVVRLDEHDNSRSMVAIAMISNVRDETMSIERIVRHFSGHQKIDEAFNWGLRWVAGSK
ncbi:TerD family protein [Paenibacillus sp. IHBB 10380]|uniref:TerD family protein n=1 Tax=Paenibacillus sp. IHBB 10380 TaxID=1566358 RepID=UPI0005CFE850|nr:TerD family protein [Paenibacillus sp. IHBB 10380]AJS60182.1 tellurium resistance protein TerA [Paenibacillus sp. IHBB 10380]